ncbi:MAG: hypothetical protein AAGK32_19800, partial [Actinomycetota bacterium]
MTVFRWNRALTVVLAALMVLPMTPLSAVRPAQAAQTFGATPLDDVRVWIEDTEVKLDGELY